MQAGMQQLLGALATLLPAAVADVDWEEQRRRQELDAALAGFHRTAAQLAAGSARREEPFRLYSRSLAADAHALERRVADGRHPAAAHLIRRLPETCVACHVRLPAESAHALAPLRQRLYAAAPDPLLRARLETAAYRFEDALATYEHEFERSAPADLALESSVPSYLLVALRVRLDPQRAYGALHALELRSDVSVRLARNLPAWRQALLDFGPALAGEPSLLGARTILERARVALHGSAVDDRYLVHRLVASSLVHRFLERRTLSRRERAEALYLLGQTEWLTRTSFERADAQHYLQQAIRTAPHTALAARAFVQLEHSLVLGYTGSSGEHVLPDVRALIEELRHLSRRRAPGTTQVNRGTGGEDDTRRPAGWR
jgi:hypothetical protein